MSAATAQSAEPEGRILWMTKKERAFFAKMATHDFDAWFTPEQAAAIEANAVSHEESAARRIALELLTRSKSELLANMTDTSAIAMIHAVDDVKRLADFMTHDDAMQATARMFATVATYNAQQRAARFAGPPASGAEHQ